MPKRVTTEVTAEDVDVGVKIPAYAEMNVIRPKMQLSGGFAPVSLQQKKGKDMLACTPQTFVDGKS